MKKILFLIAFLGILLTSCDNYKDLNFRGIKSKIAKNLGEDIYINVPPFYKKAKSYDGFQAPNYESSISLQIDEGNLEKVRKSFDKSNLSRKNSKLITLRTVNFGKADTAIFAVVEDRRKKTIRYLLSIQRGDKMYGIKAFCPTVLRDKYEPMIISALESVAIGEVVEKKEPFAIAKFVSLEHYILTRDGAYPTESEDQAIIDVYSIKSKSLGKSRDERVQYLKDKMAKYSTVPTKRQFVERVEQGHYITLNIEEGDVNIHGVLSTDNSGDGSMFICQSNDKVVLQEFKEYVRGQMLKGVLTR